MTDQEFDKAVEDAADKDFPKQTEYDLLTDGGYNLFNIEKQDAFRSGANFAKSLCDAELVKRDAMIKKLRDALEAYHKVVIVNYYGAKGCLADLENEWLNAELVLSETQRSEVNE